MTPPITEAPNLSIQSRKYGDFRREMKAMWAAVNAPCGICHLRTINYPGEKNQPDSFEMDHIISRKRCKAMGRPDLIMDPTNVQSAHTRCNRAKQAGDASPGLGARDEEW